MKLARYVHAGREAWGLIDVTARTVAPVAGTILDWGEAVTAGQSLDPVGASVPLAGVRLLPPIGVSSVVAAVGLNYWSHLEALGQTEPPATTLGFLKPQIALVGHDEEIRYPTITAQLDYEIELVAVVGRHVTGAGAPTEALLGYTVGNDTSARDAKSPLGGPDLFSMKCNAGATPLGPWITTKDEFGGAGQIDTGIALRVNGETRQQDRTSKMIWPVDELLAYVVQRIPLTTGDVLFTGTPAGVGWEDGRFLEPGDVVESEVDGIGVIRNVVGPRP
ncbi:MAG: hypothetical protein QOI86_1378 [Actinomycetota bacterium]|nr:hypothetical protein [Actinomycetota bacterium]